MVGKLIWVAIFLFVLEFLGFEISLGPWIFISVLAFCFLFTTYRDWKEENGNSPEEEEQPTEK